MDYSEQFNQIIDLLTELIVINQFVLGLVSVIFGLLIILIISVFVSSFNT